MRVTSVIRTAAALGLTTAIVLPFAARAEMVEEQRWQIERTQTETTTRAQAPAPAPVVVERNPPPVIIERQVEKPVPVPVPVEPAKQEVREGDFVTVIGHVAELDGDDLVLDVKGQRIKVETDDMETDPVEDKDGPRIGIGDRVSIYGSIDDIEDSRIREVDAKTLKVLHRNTARNTAR